MRHRQEGKTRRLIREDPAFPAERGLQQLLCAPSVQKLRLDREPVQEQGGKEGGRGTGLSSLRRGYFLRDNNNALCAPR